VPAAVVVPAISTCAFFKTYDLEVRKEEDNSLLPNEGTSAAAIVPLL
jgi:hypothetical protein